MTAIERLWDRAKDDPAQKEIVETLSIEMTVICVVCGGEAEIDRVSGCYTCGDCGTKECGDG